MASMVLGVLRDRASAETAIDELKNLGYRPEELSVMMKDSGEQEALVERTGSHAVDGAMSGASTGGIVGAVAGLLIGIGAIAIPGIGGLLIGGPIAAALGLTGAAATTATGAMTGALAGGLVGGLVGLGVPEEEARTYQGRINEGAVLLAIPADERNGREPQAILREYGAEQVRTIHTDGNHGHSQDDGHAGHVLSDRI